MKHTITRGGTTLIAATIALTTLAGGATAASNVDQLNHQAPITAPEAHTNDSTAYYFRFNANGVAIRTGPSTNYTVKGRGYRGQKAYYTNLRQRHGQMINCPPGNTGRPHTNLWSLVRNGSSGVVGWVNNCFFY